ncbi:hypothetical protein JCM9279_005268 [Rhodotorula babjevae]
MPSAASKAANARYMTELQRGANHTFAPELPEPPAHFQQPTLAGLLPPRRRALPGARVQSCEGCRQGKRACDRSETCSSLRDVRCEYIAAAPLRATIAGSAQRALNRVEITRLRAQVALLLRVLRITDAELQYLMRRADEPEPFVLPSPWAPVRWAAPVRRMSVLDPHDELPLPPVVEQREPPADEGPVEEPTAAEQEHVEPDRAPSEPAAPSPSPPAETRFMGKSEEPKAQTPKPKKVKAKATTPRRRSTRLQGGGV